MNYKIYESDITEYLKKVVNQKIISDIIDLSLEFLEDGYELSYFVKIGKNWILTGGRRFKDEQIPDHYSPLLRDYLSKNSEIKKEWEHWTDFKEESFPSVRILLESEPLKYYFRIYSIGESEDDRDQIVNKEAQSEVFDRIKGLHPNEIILTY